MSVKHTERSLKYRSCRQTDELSSAEWRLAGGSSMERTRLRFEYVFFTGPFKMILVISVFISALCFAPGMVNAQMAAKNKMWSLAIRSADHLNRGDLKGAVMGFEMATKSVAAEEMKTALALCYLIGGGAKQALKKMQKITSEGAVLSEAHYWHGRLLFLDGKNSEACKSINRALSLGGDRPEYLLAKAMICRRAGKSDAGRKALLRAIALNGELLDPRLFPNPHGAVLDLVHHSLKSFPRKQKAWVTMAYMYFNGGFYRRAEDLTNQILKRWGRVHEALLLKARCRFAAADVKGALSWVEKTLASQPSDGGALALRGELYNRLGKTERALADFERAVKINPKNPTNLTHLGYLLWKKGNYGRAERMFRYALIRAPSSALVHGGLAKALDRLKKLEDAEKHYRAAISANPASPEHRHHYALFLQRHKKNEQAETQLSIAKDLSKARSGFESKLARMSKSYSRYKSALKVAHKGKRQAAEKLLKKSAIPRVVKDFLFMHIDLKNKKGGRGKVSNAKVFSILSRLNPRKLLDPSVKVTLFTVKGKAGKKVDFVYMRRLNYVNPGLF